MRRRVFVAGVLVSLVLVLVFSVGGNLQVMATGTAPGQLNVFYRFLVLTFLVLNPVLALVGWLSLALPEAFAASRSGQAIIAVTYLVAFLGGWWVVATIIGRITMRRSGRIA